MSLDKDDRFPFTEETFPVGLRLRPDRPALPDEAMALRAEVARFRLGVLQDWIYDLPMQQQSVLMLACRGPDGVQKHHPAKHVVECFRACVLKAAHYGRPLESGERTPGFMTLEGFNCDKFWNDAVTGNYFDFIDELPHHYHLHLMHGAQIIGYKHPKELFRNRWRLFYLRCCADMHLHLETEDEMDARLNDFDRVSWERSLSEPAALTHELYRLRAFATAIGPCTCGQGQCASTDFFCMARKALTGIDNDAKG